ncbi:MAG: YceI family protein [Myxococcaceae bacterium]
MGKWNIDPSHSEVTFTVRHMVVAKVRGTFTKLTGTVESPDDDPSHGKVDVTIDTASISTRDDKRDEHLRSADFFNVQQHPELRFRSTGMEGSGKKLKMKGTLDMHGVTQPVTLDVEHLGQMKDPWGNMRQLFHAETSLNRKDFGLHWNQALEAGGFLVGDKIDIEVEAQLVPA